MGNAMKAISKAWDWITWRCYWLVFGRDDSRDVPQDKTRESQDW